MIFIGNFKKNLYISVLSIAKPKNFVVFAYTNVLRSQALFQGSVQQKLRWVENIANRWVLAWDCGAGHYFKFLFHRHLVLNIFPFPVSTVKLIGNFFKKERSAANSYPCFAYSFASLMLRQYYLSCDSYSANR
jgi:hypothetical protein